MRPEQIGVAPLSRSLASWTLVTPRRCLVNNCLIFSRFSLRLSLSLSPSLPNNRIHSLLPSFRGCCWFYETLEKLVVTVATPLLSPPGNEWRGIVARNDQLKTLPSRSPRVTLCSLSLCLSFSFSSSIEI